MRRCGSLMVKKINGSLEKSPFSKHGTNKVAPKPRRRIREGKLESSSARRTQEKSKDADHVEMAPRGIWRRVQTRSVIWLLHCLTSFKIGEHEGRVIVFGLAFHELVSIIWHTLPALELAQVLGCLAVVMATKRGNPGDSSF